MDKPDWQPIETAPQHGKRILFLMREGEGARSGSDRVHIGWFNRWGEPCWQGLAHNPAPVAWMPLPKPDSTPTREAIEDECRKVFGRRGL